jgi:hypothetical protein
MARVPYKYKIELSMEEKQEFQQAICQGCKSARLVIRILIILAADAGKALAETAAFLGCCEQTALNQRKRFLARREEGPVLALMDLPRSGRPVIYGARERTLVVATVCETLYKHDLPLSRFSTTDLLHIVAQEEGLAHLSHASLARILDQNALKPWRYRYWLFPRDPDFIRKACVILDLYAGFWKGQRLGPEEYLLSADEKSIQILRRCHPGLPTLPGYAQRVEFEYERLGTVAYHAAWDVFRGQIFGRVAPNTCIATFNQLVDMIMTQAPYQNSTRTFWIVDGGCAHHPNTFPGRLKGMYPNAVAVSLPVHSSWLNQIEIYFSIVQRKVLTPMNASDEKVLTTRVLDFQDYYQETANPFTWKFTAADLKNRLDALKHFIPTSYTLETSEMQV